MWELGRIQTCLHNSPFSLRSTSCLLKRFSRQGSRQTQSNFINQGETFLLLFGLSKRKKGTGQIAAFGYLHTTSTSSAFEDFVEGSVTGDPKPDSFSLTGINCFTWSNSIWSIIKLQVPSGTIQYNDMLRCWDLFGEAVDDSGVEKAQIQSGSVFPFLAVYSSCAYCLALTHRPELQLMNHCSYFLLQVPLGRSAAA